MRDFYFTTLAEAKSCTDPEIRLNINLPKSEKQWATILALPNLKELILDVSAGFGDLPEALREARQIKKLRFDDLAKTKEMTPIPRILLELDYLEVLEFVHCDNLTWEDEDWSGLKSLKRFYTYSSGTHFPEGIFSLPVVESLWLSAAFKWGELPKGWSKLSHLKDLNIDSFGLKTADIYAIPALEQLRIPCKECIPEWLSQLNPNTLKKLQLHGYYYDEGTIPIPDFIFNFSQLEELQLYSFRLTEISPKIAQLQQLRVLDLRYNKLSSLPDSMAQLGKLETFLFSMNGFVHLPGVVAKLSSLKKVDYERQSAHSSELTRYEKFLKWFELHTWDQLLREVLADFWDGSIYQPKAVDYQQIEKALSIGIAPINTHALTWLTQHSAQAYTRPQKGDTIGVLAKIALKRAELKEKLQVAGVELAQKLDDSAVTHLVVDEKCGQGSLRWLGNERYKLMTEAQLVAFLNEVQPDYLVEDAQNNRQSEMVTQVNGLLFSMDAANIGIGLSLLKTGGVPEACKTALFVIYKLAEDAKQRGDAGKLLQTVASDALRDAMKKRVNFLSKDTPGTYQLYSYLSTYDQTEIDMGLFARIYAKPHKYVDIQFYLIRRGDSDHLRAYYQERVDEKGFLDISISYGREGIDAVPVEVFDTKGVKSLKIYAYLYTKPNLELFCRPELAKLTELESLQIYITGSGSGSISQVPPALVALKQLKQLKINATNKVVEQLREALPGCVVSS